MASRNLFLAFSAGTLVLGVVFACAIAQETRRPATAASPRVASRAVPNKPKPPEYIFTGRVTSRYGPVAGARVRVQGQDKMVLTDARGRFVLRSPLPRRGRLLVTAGKAGWFNSAGRLGRGGNVGNLVMAPLFLGDQPGYIFLSPRICFMCHTKVTRIWAGAKMSRALANPLLWDMYYGTAAGGRLRRGPGWRRDNPRQEGSCAVCHAPTAAANPARSLDLRTIARSRRTEWTGISCDYCHKVRQVVPDMRKPGHASAVLERQWSRRWIMVFGPYDDTVAPPMAASYSPVFGQGRFCSTCHSHFRRPARGRKWDWSKIYTAREWAGFGLKGNAWLPIQTTYNEWKQWQDSLGPRDPNKGKRCQSCHMGWEKRLLPYDHYLVDGMARRMWGVYRSPSSITPHLFEGGTRTQLQNALGMELEGKIKGNRLVIKVHISNTNGGHWVPTGETMRNVILLVSAKDSAGKALKLVKGGRLPWWAGRGKPTDGNYAGLPGAIFARVLADDRGHLNVPFWRATRIVQDNRIRPKKTVTLEFVYALTNPNDEPSALAKLIYRPVVRPLARIKGWRVKDILITQKAW